MVNIKETYPDPILNLVFDTLNQSKQAIIFANTKSGAEKTAEDIAKNTETKDVAFIKIAEEALHSLSAPTKQCKRLAYCLNKGIAFHHAGLTAKQREIIEENFKNKTIKIIVATPTLAAGVDLPAFRVIIKDLRRYGTHGLQFIPVLEYMQMSGRAGRPKFDNRGESIIVASTKAQKEEFYDRFIKGEPEQIFSKLAAEPALRTYILSLIATNFVRTKSDIFDFFSRTFWAYQFADTRKLFQKIEEMIALLLEWEFIDEEGSSSEFREFRSASELVADSQKYRATILGKRVAELYLDPYTAYFLVNALKKAQSKPVSDFSFLHALSSTLEIRPQLKARVKDAEIINDALIKFGSTLLTEEPSIYDEEYEEFSNSLKTALFFHDWVDEKDEEYLLESYNIRPGEIKVKLDIADWLVYCMEEIIRILQFKPLMPELKKLRIRIQNGVKEELIPLLKFKNIGRVRARKLFRNGIKDIKDVKDADLTKLTQILGKNIALDLKSQVGEEVKIVRENKRVGQISLKDYGE
jgi:helicase